MADWLDYVKGEEKWKMNSIAQIKIKSYNINDIHNLTKIWWF